jgi:hypothetical protein
MTSGNGTRPTGPDGQSGPALAKQFRRPLVTRRNSTAAFSGCLIHCMTYFDQTTSKLASANGKSKTLPHFSKPLIFRKLACVGEIVLANIHSDD